MNTIVNPDAVWPKEERTGLDEVYLALAEDALLNNYPATEYDEGGIVNLAKLIKERKDEVLGAVEKIAEDFMMGNNEKDL